MHTTITDLSNIYTEDKVERWLSAPDSSSNFNRAKAQRHGNSGNWFLQSESFTMWKKQPNSFLWLHGIPGCGKTVLSSTVIEELNKNGNPMIFYFYFDFKDARKQSFEHAVRSLIHQFRARSSGSWKQLDSLFSYCAEGKRQPTIESLRTVLLDIIQQTKEVWIVFDALDECEKEVSSNQTLLSWIKSLIQAKKGNVHVLVTSRPEHHIDARIREFANDEHIIRIQSDLVSDDIRAYTRARVKDGLGFMRWRSRPQVQDEIESKLIAKAGGM